MSTYGNVVDPDEVGSTEGESISTPDVLVVQVADLDVLDNYVLASEGKTLALDDTLGSDTKDSLVGANLDWVLRGLVVGDCLLDRSSIARIQQDTLALSTGSPVCAYFH